MSTSKMSSTPEDVNVVPILSPEAQRDLDDALDETPTPEDMKKAWVDENIRDLYKAFARGRKSDPLTQDGMVEVFKAVEGSENDLRNVLVSNVILARCDRLGVKHTDADVECNL